MSLNRLMRPAPAQPIEPIAAAAPTPAPPPPAPAVSAREAATAPKVRKIVTFLQDMEHEAELRTVPVWKAHQMTGDRKGAWSLMVTKNWRITFQIDRQESEIFNLNFEDYH